MTKYILHGGFTRRDNESNRTFYKEFVSGIPNGGTVLLIYFASRSDDITEVSEEQKMLFSAEAAEKNLSFLVATEEDFLKQIKESDGIYIHGGSTNKLLRVLRTYPDLRPLVEGKTIAGSSAGAYALVKFGASHSEEVVREGLGLVPLRVVCHYESLELPPSSHSIAILKETAQDF